MTTATMTENTPQDGPGWAQDGPGGSDPNSDARSAADGPHSGDGEDARDEDREDDAPVGREAARYRRRLREVEAERDALAGQLDTVRRQVVERVVSDLGLPSSRALWAHASLDDLLNHSGLYDLATRPGPQLPRLVWLAQSRADRHGHAAMRSGEVGRVLGIADRNNVQRLIRQAVAAGFLDPQSGTRCLVLPAYLHRKASDWRPRRAPCDRHAAKRAGPTPEPTAGPLAPSPHPAPATSGHTA